MEAKVESPASRQPRSPVAAAAALAAVSLYAMLQLYALFPHEGDENIYIYLASRAAEGAWPYRDFFHAHPPLHLLPAILAFRIVGFELMAIKSISMGAAIVGGLLLYRGGRRLGRAEGPLACAFFLLSYHGLVLSGFFLGTSLCAMWVALGLERVGADRPRQAGVAFALATSTLLLAAPIGVGVGAAILLRDRTAAVRYAVSGLAAWAALNAAAWFWFGPSYIDQVYAYHLGKTGVAGSGVFRGFAYTDPWILYAALAGVTVTILRALETSATGPAAPIRAWAALPPLLSASVGGALASVIFLALVPQIFAYYFLPAMVCAAPLAALGVAEIVRRARAAWLERLPARAAEAGILLGIACLGMLPFAAGRTADSLPPGPYRWRDSGVAAVDALTRTLFWHDEKREKTWYGPITRHLWVASQRFDGAEVLAREVAARSRPGETIFGDSESVPLIALLAERRVALDEADTNALRFRREGNFLGALLERLDADPPRIVIGRSGVEIFSFPAFNEWVESSYTRVSVLYEASVRDRYDVWVRNDSASGPKH